MIHEKFQPNIRYPAVFGEKVFIGFAIFTIGGHLGFLTRLIFSF